MTYTADPRVDAYIDALPGWQQVICREIRDLIHASTSFSTTVRSSPIPMRVRKG
jgi:hypothetical protein